MIKTKGISVKREMTCLFSLVLLLVSGCAIFSDKNKAENETGTKAADKVEAAVGQTALTPVALQNSVYHSEYFKEGQVKLTNGKYESAGIVISLDEQMRFGDVTGDRIEDAVVVLVTDTGGNGAFYDLAVVVDENGTPANIASTYLGDRVKIESIYIEAGKVTVSMVMHGETDPDCCPTLKVVKTYRLQGATLVEQ
jgi:hypothetical protein